MTTKNNFTLSDFDFDLPESLIANYPLTERSASRLLCLDRADANIAHHLISELPLLLKSGDLLVFNNTKVIKARLRAEKLTGGKIEIMLEKIISDNSFLAQIKTSKSLKEGTIIKLIKPKADPKADKVAEIYFKLIGRQDDMFLLEVVNSSLTASAVFDAYGSIPLPHYIKRGSEDIDLERYQTIYATKKGAVAAPTAGLHFDEKLFAALKAKGIQFAFITLHVGAGTFKPVRTENIYAHKMHSEYYEINDENAEKINRAKKSGRRVIAVGTTVVRTLETIAKSGELKAGHGETDIFIYPGYKFQLIDAMLTNFHLPRSTLLMLISAFGGHETIKKAYQQAVQEKYRFFSYGDAMLIT